LAGSPLVAHARAAGVSVICEAFADRAYQADGQLVSRSKAGAVLHDAEEIAARMLAMARDGSITAITGERITIEAQSICIHGDSPDAVAIARQVAATLRGGGIALQSFCRDHSE